MRAFLRTWAVGYINPSAFARALEGKPAPHWGLYAQLLRGAFDSLLLYLPLYLLGRQPPTPSFLTFIPTESYYGTLIWLTPIVFSAQWLIGGALMHVILRLSKRRSDIDQLLNIGGMEMLIIGAFLLVWDWVWLLAGGVDQYFLGISHLLIDSWGIVIVVVALKRLLGVPVWLGVLLNVAGLAVAMPFAVIIMRSPL